MRRVRALCAALAVVLAAALAAPAVPRAEAADAQFVLAALDVLEAHYVDPLSAPRMLNAALDSVRRQFHVQPFGGPIPADADDAEAAAWFVQRFDEMLSQAEDRASATDLAYAAVAGMLDSLHDSHTGFIPPALYQEEQRRESGQAAFTGVGIELLARDGQFYVDEVYPGSPAERAGVRPFDRVLSVDGRETAGLPDDAVSTMIRGRAGTPVVLTVARAGAAAPLAITVIRGPIRVPLVASRMLGAGIGYVKIYEFAPGAGEAFRQAVYGLRRSGLRALVLDLRKNPGGLVGELRNVASALLPPNSPFIRMRSRSGRRVLLETLDPPILPAAMPLAVLVDGGTGSAAELLAAALQERSRAVITGTQTAGAVAVGIVVNLPEGAGMAVTVARVLSGGGAQLEGHGVTPDVPALLTTVALNLGEDSQLKAALRLLRVRIEERGSLRPAPASRARAA